MRKNFAILILLFLVNICLFSQAGIDYYPKSLKSELKKLNGIETQLQELFVPEQFSRSLKFGKFYFIDNVSNVLSAKYIYIGRVNTCRAGGCALNIESTVDANSEYFDYFILYDSDLSIRYVKIYNYQATHGYEVSSSNWLKQFQGYDGSRELIAGKNIDAISGATISVDATTFDIEHKTQLLRKILKK